MPDAATGRKHPISLKTAEKRIVVREVVEGRPVARVVTTYQSHFADCPERERFRRGED